MSFHAFSSVQNLNMMLARLSNKVFPLEVTLSL
jgi:hypothetical protein